MILKTAAPNAPGTQSWSTLLSLVGPVFRRHRLRLALGFVALLAVDGLQLTIPRFIKFAVDRLEDGTADPDGLLRIAGWILTAALAMALLRFVWRYMLIGFSRILETKLRERIFSHVLTMDQAFFDRWTTGDLMAHATNDLSAVQLACGMGMVAAVDAVVICLAAIGFMVAIDAKLALLALLPMPFLAVTTKILSGRLHKRFQHVQELFSRLTEASRASIASIRLLKAYTLESYQEDGFDRLGRKYVRANLRVAAVQGLLFPAATMAGSLGMLMVLYFGGRLVVGDVITLGDFVAFITYLYMLVWPMMAVGWVTNLAQRGITSLRRIQSLLAEEPLVRPFLAGRPSAPTIPAFSFQNLSFSYPGSARKILDGVTFAVDSGVVGLAGPTGAGKSTLCRLLLRLYPVADGQLFMGGVDVNLLDVGLLRREIAYVGQEPVLFSDSLAGNIRFARPEASMAEVIEAAELAAIHGTIDQFPKGYDTLIGERGVKLSGGQKQRVALARALLSGRSVLLIDDGLSALDVETEQQVLEGLISAARFRSIIIISHRVNVLRHADRILILESGRIAMEGRHRDLLDNEFYQTMVSKQLNHA